MYTLTYYSWALWCNVLRDKFIVHQHTHTRVEISLKIRPSNVSCLNLIRSTLGTIWARLNTPSSETQKLNKWSQRFTRWRADLAHNVTNKLLRLHLLYSWIGDEVSLAIPIKSSIPSQLRYTRKTSSRRHEVGDLLSSYQAAQVNASRPGLSHYFS